MRTVGAGISMESVLDPDLQPPVPITLGELRARPESTPGGCEEAGSNRAGRKEGKRRQWAVRGAAVFTAWAERAVPLHSGTTAGCPQHLACLAP